MRRPVSTIVLGAALLFGIGLAPLASSSIIPVSLAPYSLITTAPALFASAFLNGDYDFVAGAVFGALFAPTAFIALARSVLRSGNVLPKVSIAVFAALVILSCALAVVGWSATVQYTSLQRAISLVAQSILPPALLIAAWLLFRDRLTIDRSIALHWFALAWLSWSAFPWYGELL